MLQPWFTLATIVALTNQANAADVDAFRPAASLANGFGSLQVEAPNLVGYGFIGGLNFNLAENLLVSETAIGNIENTVDSTSAFSLYGGYVIERKARFDLFLPVYGYQTVQPGSSSPLEEFRGAALGDIRLQTLIPLYDSGSDAFSVSLIPRIGIPTGSPKALLNQGFHGGFTAALGGTFPEGFGYLANVGLTLAPGQELLDLNMGSTIDLSASADYRISELDRIGFEVDGRLGIASKPTNSVFTGHAFAQKRMSNGLGMTVGLGSGFLSGVGAPSVRLFAAVSYALSIVDFDRDEFEDDVDACPEIPEDRDNFEDDDGCPDLDNDADGFADEEDDCPNQPEDYDAFVDTDGCPEPDNDGDGILDVEDRCPMTNGAASLQGCPDRDGDGIGDGNDNCPDHAGPQSAGGCPDVDEDGVSDLRDQCPNEPPPADEPKEHSNGCPKTAYASLVNIRVQSPIVFKGRTANLTKESEQQLRQVFRALKEAQRISLIQIKAHTDNDGEPEENLQLSRDRAETVMRFLVRMGINPDRLVAKGEGEEYPVDTNRTEGGRARNNRIEMIILRQTIKRPGEPDEFISEGTSEPQSKVGRLGIQVHHGEWAHVYINNQKISPKAPFRDFTLPAGDQLLWVANPATGLDHTETVEIIPGHEVIVHIGEPENDYFRNETPYGIQFRATNTTEETEEEEVTLPWKINPDAKPKTPSSRRDVQQDLTEYPSSN